MSKNELLVVIHSNSLSSAATEDQEVVNTLLSYSRLKEILILATPFSDGSSLATFPKEVLPITYQDYNFGSFVATYQTPTSKPAVLVHSHIPSSIITELYGCELGSPEFKKINEEFRDLLTFEAVSRRKSESVFVTQSPFLLEKNTWIRKRFEVKILSFVQALEYLDLYLKKKNVYYTNPYTRQVDGRAFHYWFLLKDIIPKFAEAWSIAVFGKGVIRNGQKILDSLGGLADRVQNALCSSDRIAIEYMKRPVNSTQWEILYNFNYFCMLVTGTFDSLAWLTVHRYDLQVDHPINVSIRVAGHRSRGAKFVRTIAQHNVPLAAFLTTEQNLINLFYPMRNATQHREPIEGGQFVQVNEGWTASLANLKQDAADVIKLIDHNRYPFSEWGLLNVSGIPRMLEPYRFTRRALRILMGFGNTFLEFLDFPSLIASHPDLITKIRDTKQGKTEAAFISKIYWRRPTHLPILFRNR